MATSTTSRTQNVFLTPQGYLAKFSNSLVIGAAKADEIATTAAQTSSRAGAILHNARDDNTLSFVEAIDTEAATSTSDATVTTIATIEDFAGAAAIIEEDEMWRIEVTLFAIEGADSGETLWQRTVWHVFGQAGSTFQTVVAENDGPNVVAGTNLNAAVGLTLDTTGGNMVIKVTGIAATTINWHATYLWRVYNKQ